MEENKKMLHCAADIARVAVVGCGAVTHRQVVTVWLLDGKEVDGMVIATARLLYSDGSETVDPVKLSPMVTGMDVASMIHSLNNVLSKDQYRAIDPDSIRKVAEELPQAYIKAPPPPPRNRDHQQEKYRRRYHGRKK